MDFERILEGIREDFGKDLTLQTMIRATKGISMDGEVLIIGKVVGSSGGVPKGLPCVEVRTWSLRCGPCFFRLIFERASGAFFLIFGAFWGGFGRPKWRPKSIFRPFFSMFFSSAFRHRFLMVFGRLET